MENRGIWSAMHGMLFVACLAASMAFSSGLVWPWYLALPLFAYYAIVWVTPPLRRTIPRLALGQMHGGPLAFAALVIVVIAGVLVAFHAIVRPDVQLLVGKLPVAGFGQIALAGICFSVLNAVLEELLFRGVLWDVVAAEWNPWVALGVTSVIFGVGHLQGYPPGALGAGIAGLYGVVLGGLRWRTGGLGLAILCHIGADATIFWILAATGAFGEF